MNRQPIWIIAPFVLLLSSLAWWAHAQSVGETPESSPTWTLRRQQSGDIVMRIILGSKPSQQKERILEEQTRALVEEYRANSDTGKWAVAKDNLTAVVNEHFALRQAERQRELDELAKELDRLTALNQRRQNQQDKIVADRVESLLREADGLGWGSSSSRRGGVPRGFQNTHDAVPPIATATSRR